VPAWLVSCSLMADCLAAPAVRTMIALRRLRHPFEQVDHAGSEPAEIRAVVRDEPTLGTASVSVSTEGVLILPLKKIFRKIP
jgi:hypothetical protein